MKYRSVFDIIGPVMIGPSSSHTAGAAKIGRIAKKLFDKEILKADIYLYGSFSKTYKGHATDIAVVGGLLDIETSDPKIINSLSIAKKKGIEINFIEEEAITEHPNTLKIILSDAKGYYTEIVGISVGGGSIQIVELDGFALRLTGEHPAILIMHKDVRGTIASVVNVLSSHEINISHMEVSRKEKGTKAIMVIETDENIREDAIKDIESKDNIVKVILLTNKGGY